MTFLEALQAHKGGLIRPKTELYWYGGRGYDGSPGRICLVLDAADGSTKVSLRASTIPSTTAAATAAALLLIDGSPHWVWVAVEDVEFL